MRTAVYYNNHDVRIEERDVPEIGLHEILVKVRASGICGSDVMEWYRIKKAPIILGHEIAGDIVKVGQEVKKYKTGERVFVSHHIPCNTCLYCLSGNHTACKTLQTTNYDPGGFSEFIRIPELNVDRGVFPLPDSVSYREGAFIEPLACVIRGQRVANLRPGQSVLVMGSGISGLLHIMSAKALGAGRIISTDINDTRLQAASRFGAENVFNAGDLSVEKLRDVNDGRLVDLVIICTGVLSVFEQALKMVERGGTVLFFAPTDPGIELSIPVNDFWRNSITLLPSYGNSPRDAVEAIELIRAKRVPVEEMITHTLPLEKAAEGFKLVSDGKDCLKVIIEP